jgi:hypothetical protein
MVLVEGVNADGVTVDEDNFDVVAGDGSATSAAADQAIAAIQGTRESAAEGGYRLTSTGVTWTAPAQAAALRDALGSDVVGPIMLVSPLLAAAALAQTVGAALRYAHTAWPAGQRWRRRTHHCSRRRPPPWRTHRIRARASWIPTQWRRFTSTFPATPTSALRPLPTALCRKRTTGSARTCPGHWFRRVARWPPPSSSALSHWRFHLWPMSDRRLVSGLTQAAAWRRYCYR